MRLARPRRHARALLGVLTLAAAAAGCSRAKAPGDEGGRLKVEVDGRTVALDKGVLELELRSDRHHDLTLLSHDTEMNRLVLEFDGEGATEAEWVGKPLSIDFRGENPERHRLGTEVNVSRFTDGGKYYEAYQISGTLTALTGGQGTLEMKGTVLEFPDDPNADSDDGSETPGREVAISARVSLPVTVNKD